MEFLIFMAVLIVLIIIMIMRIKHHGEEMQLIEKHQEAEEQIADVELFDEELEEELFGRKRQGRRSSTPKQRSNGKVKREFDLFDRCSGDYVVIDVETTGLQPENSSIIELAALKINNGNIVDTYETLVNHGKNVSKEITKINGITTEMLKGKPSIEKVLPEYLLFIGNNPVMGHNIAFDVKFILFNSIKCGLSFDPPYVVDTLLLSRIDWPEL